MLYLRNLSSQEMRRGLPWEFTPAQPIPDEVRTDKKARDEWINRPATDHCVYSFFEGVNPNLRISKPRSDGNGNPVHSCRALCGDFDSKQPESLVLKLANEFVYPPNWIEKTLSGNWRFVWLLEEALIFPSYEFAKHFFGSFASFAFDPNTAMIGFDAPAWKAPERLFTNSCDWRKLHDNKITADVSRGWLVQASAKYKFTDNAEFGIAIPIELIKPELEKLFPKFSQWPGEFTLNSQGPTFWIPESTSPKSAIVRETGLQTFSANAAKGFYAWRDLLGAAFVKEYESQAIGRAVENIFTDGRHYWRPVLDGSWQPFDKTDLSLHLRASRGISGRHDKSGVSDIDRAVEYIQNAQRVTSAAPFIFNPPGVIIRGSRRYLNTSNVRVMQPAEGPAVWGAAGQFPWLSNFLDKLFDPVIQLTFLLCWAAWAYQGFYYGQPHAGQVLFIAGPPNVGKTLLNRAILGRMFGGCAEAAAFLLGNDQFNSELFQVPLWVVDDTEVSSSPAKMRMWGGSLKRVAANPTFRCNEKFRAASLLEWLGRLGTTCNADEQSVLVIPDLSTSILDKLILLRTVNHKSYVFPEQYILNKILDTELPWLCRYLLDFKIPSDFQGEARFGVKGYAEPSLLETSRQSSSSAGFAEILDDWRKEFFTVREPKAAYFEGTAFQLHKAICLDQSSENAMRSYTVEAVGRQLSALKNKDSASIESISRGEIRVWRIYRENKPTNNPKT